MEMELKGTYLAENLVVDGAGDMVLIVEGMALHFMTSFGMWWCTVDVEWEFMRREEESKELKS